MRLWETAMFQFEVCFTRLILNRIQWAVCKPFFCVEIDNLKSGHAGQCGEQLWARQALSRCNPLFARCLEEKVLHAFASPTGLR